MYRNVHNITYLKPVKPKALSATIRMKYAGMNATKVKQ